MIGPMTGVLDHQAEAIAAMKKAIAATCPAERLKWLRTALAWKDLASFGEGEGGSVKAAANPSPLKTSRSYRSSSRARSRERASPIGEHCGSRLAIHRMCGRSG